MIPKYVVLLLLIFNPDCARSIREPVFREGAEFEVEKDADEGGAAVIVNGYKAGHVKRVKLNRDPVLKAASYEDDGGVDIEEVDCVFTGTDGKGLIIQEVDCPDSPKSSTIISEDGAFTVEHPYDSSTTNFLNGTVMKNGKKGAILEKAHEESPTIGPIDAVFEEDYVADFKKWQRKQELDPKNSMFKRKRRRRSKYVKYAAVYDQHFIAAAKRQYGRNYDKRVRQWHTRTWQVVCAIFKNLQGTKCKEKYAKYFKKLRAVKGYRSGHSIDSYLNTMRAWSRRKGKGVGQNVWGFITGIDLCAEDGCGVIGYAPLSSVCQSSTNGFAAEASFHSKHYNAALFAHEIGHTLGLEHDDTSGCAYGHIMWPMVVITKSWSGCSKSQYTNYRNYLISRGMYCLKK